MAKVLVTGSTGLLGSAIASVAEDTVGHEFIFHSRDVCDLENSRLVAEYIGAIKPDVVIHTAALVGGIQANSKYPFDFYAINSRIDNNVLRACTENGVPEFIGFLSSCIFPDKASYPIKYNSIHEGPPHPSNFGYAHAKRGLDTAVAAARVQFGLKYKLFIPTNLFGEHDNFDLSNSHVIPGLIHRFFQCSRSGDIPTVWGSGSPLREFVYARDAAEFILGTIGKSFFSPVFLNNGGRESAIREVAEIIAREFQIEDRLRFDTTKPDGQLRKPTQNEGWVEKELGVQKSTKLQISLKNTIQWFQERYPEIRGVTSEL